MRKAVFPNRTQISLSDDLKTLIEARGALAKESLSEYLRRSALIRMALENQETNENIILANAVVGSVPKAGSGWAKIGNIAGWQRKERQNENPHRA
jgi:hypothetical protein